MAKKFAEHNGLNLTQTNNGSVGEKRYLKSIDEREGQFIFFRGPPSATYHPGIHHVLARSIKDTFNRYKTMERFQVHRKAMGYPRLLLNSVSRRNSASPRRISTTRLHCLY